MLEIGAMIQLEVLVVVLLSTQLKPPSSTRKSDFCHRQMAINQVISRELVKISAL